MQLYVIPSLMVFFFFFQAEDGIRDYKVTGVQTCALPILLVDRITLRATNTPTPSPPSPLTASIMGPIEQLVAEQFPGIPVVPVMEAGATDGLALRNAGIPTYGVSAVFEEQNDVRAHGRDERVGVQSFYDGLEFWYRMMQAFASGRLTR